MPKKILLVGAHPDDPDTSAGGLATKLAQKGWEVRFLSLTGGGCGHFTMSGKPLEERRFAEAQASGAVIGARYDVMGLPDGQLEATLENRERLIRYIREFAPDIIITNRICDYHADHRATALLVQDASFLLTVPAICSDTPFMHKMPVIMFWYDGFMRPAPFTPDVVVPVEQYLPQVLQMAISHRSQYFEWMMWHGKEGLLEQPEEKKIADLDKRFADEAARLGKPYGLSGAELYEISEYGEELSPELRRELEQ